MALNDTALYKELHNKCSRGEAHPLESSELLGMVSKATRELGDRLNRAYGNFDDYTLHDEHHAERVVYLMGRLLQDDSNVSAHGNSLNLIDKLSVIDIALLVLSAYGHDIGMSLSRTERETVEQTADYRDFLLRNDDRWLEAEASREKKDAQRCEFIRSQLFQDFLRGRHHLKSRDLVRGELAHLFVVQEKSLAGAVGDLCYSHGIPVSDVGSIREWPFAGRFFVDLPFLACVLRLADYLDLDALRAPQSLVHLIRQDNERARREWRKHQASNFFVSPHKIEFQARFSDFFEEKALRDTLKGIEQERRECMDFLRLRREANTNRLCLHLDSPVDPHIEADGYLFEEFRFQLEYSEIISLLMGTRLYRDERVFIRELLQNALDACRHAEAARKKAGQGFAGRITVRLLERQSGEQIIEISDNGSGMTKAIIRDYFMRVGRSFYRSFAFRRQNLGFNAVSQFGIGILSCFMNSDYIEVDTSPDPVAQAGAKPEDLQSLKLEINGPMEFFVVKPLERATPGTTVRVFMTKPLTESVTQIVQRYVGRIPYTVEVNDRSEPPIELSKEPFDFESERFSGAFVKIPDAFGYRSNDLVFDGVFGFDVVGRIRFYLLEEEGRRHLELKGKGKYSFVGFTAEGETLVNVKQMTSDARKSVDSSLQALRQLSPCFSQEPRDDLNAILRQIDRLCDYLIHQHDAEQARTRLTSISAQVDSLATTPSFQDTAACVKTQSLLRTLLNDVDSFVSGNFRICAPVGVLTQDGINITGMFDLPGQLRLGIGYLFNLDLCGEHRFSLNAARDAVIVDDQAQRVISYLYHKIGTFLGEWFRSENVPGSQVQHYLGCVPRLLGEHVSRASGRRIARSGASRGSASPRKDKRGAG